MPSFRYLRRNVSTLDVPSFRCFFPPSPVFLNLLSIPSARWQTLSSGRPCFLPVFPGFRGEGWRRVKGERSALCSVQTLPLSTQPLLCNTVSPPLDHTESEGGGDGVQSGQSISCAVAGGRTAEWTLHFIPYLQGLSEGILMNCFTTIHVHVMLADAFYQHP